MRSASVDLPWSMWAMMQKFRICAGAVKVWSAKLLMGISWWDGLWPYQGIEAGARPHNPVARVSRPLIAAHQPDKTRPPE
jgi:hypothetical protein